MARIYGLDVASAVVAPPGWAGSIAGFSQKLTRLVEFEGGAYRSIIIRRPNVEEVRSYRAGDAGPLKMLAQLTSFPVRFFEGLSVEDGMALVRVLRLLVAETEERPR